MEKIEAIVKGRVQGVGFRYFVQRTAEPAGICGYVKNLPDGTVEVVAEGKPEQLDHLMSALERGPSFSSVTDIDVRREQVQAPQYNSFNISY